MTFDEFIAGCIAATILVGVGCAIGQGCGQSEFNKRAVEAGAGEYRADPRTGQTQFVFFPRPTTAPVEKGP